MKIRLYNSKDALPSPLHFWRIRNRVDVKIWEDPQLLTPISFTIQSPIQVLRETATIQKLIDQDMKWWNRELVERIYTPAKVGVINKLHVSCTIQIEILIQQGTTTSEVLVHNAYHMEKERQDSLKGKCSNRHSKSEF